jgi:hypothetical protein
MLNSTVVFLVACAFIFGGVLIGVGLRRALPEHHLSDGRKATVSVGAPDFRAMARRCSELNRFAVRSGRREQLRECVEDFEA